MELRQLRYFEAVARERNFTRAAGLLGIAQPPLSRAIRQLEDELGAQLFERGTRPVRLTEIGRIVFEQATAVLERADGIVATIGRLQSTGGIRIGFVGSMLYSRLPEVVRAYRKAHPEAELGLVELTTLEQVSALKDGRIDIGFGRLPFEDPAIERTLVEEERLWVALPGSHHRCSGLRPLRLAELAAESLIIYPKSPRPSYADQVLALFREQALRPHAVREVRELQTALGLVAAEDGVCIVPAAVQPFRRENVSYKELAEERAVSPIIMSVRRGDPSTHVAAIVRLVSRVYRKELAAAHKGDGGWR